MLFTNKLFLFWDKIFVLKNGRIVDSGNHEHLIKNSNEYKSLYEKQMR